MPEIALSTGREEKEVREFTFYSACNNLKRYKATKFLETGYFSIINFEENGPLVYLVTVSTISISVSTNSPSRRT